MCCNHRVVLTETNDEMLQTLPFGTQGWLISPPALAKMSFKCSFKELYKHVIFFSNQTLQQRMEELALSPALLSRSVWSTVLVLGLGFSYAYRAWTSLFLHVHYG